jgi:hypothetical protein
MSTAVVSGFQQVYNVRISKNMWRMGMRNLSLLVIIIMSLFLTACGGGGDSSYTRDAKIAVKMDFENSRATESGFMVGNTLINAVNLKYTNLSTNTATLKNITSEAEEGVFTLHGLEAGATYLFEVSAIGSEGTAVCAGSASIAIIEDETQDVNIDCVFEEVYAMENSVYEFVSLLASSEQLTAEEVDAYIAKDFGLMDGMTREQFIADMTDDPGFEFVSSDVTLEKIEIVSPKVKGRADIAESILKMYFSDGTIDTERIVLAKEGENWVLTGNGKKYYSDVYPEVVKYGSVDPEFYPMGQVYIAPDGTEQPSLLTGLSIDVDDDSMIVETVSLSGDGIPQTAIMKDSYDMDYFRIDQNYSFPFYEMQDSFIVYDTMMGKADPLDGSVYTFATTYTDGTSDTVGLEIFAAPLALSEITEAMFPKVTSPSDFNIANYLDAPITFTYEIPTAFTPYMVEMDVHFSDYDGNHYDNDFWLPLDKTSFTIDFSSVVGFVPTAGTIDITAYDEFGRAYTVYYALYTDYSTPTDPSEPTGSLPYMLKFASDLPTGIEAATVASQDEILYCGFQYDSQNGASAIAGSLSKVDGSSTMYAIDGLNAMQSCSSVKVIGAGTYAGNSYFAGSNIEMMGTIIQIDSTGNLAWAKDYGSSIGSLTIADTELINTDNLAVLATTDTGEIIVAEVSSADGTVVRAKAISVANEILRAKTFDIGPAGEVFIVGYKESYPYNEGLVVALDETWANGVVDSVAFTDTANSNTQVSAVFSDVQFDIDGNAIVSGHADLTNLTFTGNAYTNSSSPFNVEYPRLRSIDGTNLFLTSSAGTNSMNVAKFDNSMAFAWSKLYTLADSTLSLKPKEVLLGMDTVITLGEILQDTTPYTDSGFFLEAGTDGSITDCSTIAADAPAYVVNDAITSAKSSSLPTITTDDFSGINATVSITPINLNVNEGLCY